MCDPITKELKGFNVVVGGGMGRSHRNEATFAMMAEPIGYVPKDDIFHAVKAIVATQRDYGRRDDRKQARLKYLLHEWGMDKFRRVTEQYYGKQFEAFKPLPPWEHVNYLGWGEQGDGKLYCGVYVQNGRVKGVAKKAFREVVEKYGLNAIITAEQDLVLTGIDPADRAAVQATLEAAGLDTEAGAGANPTNRLDASAIACPALPLCGLAMSEAERGLPDINARLVALLDRMGLGDESFVVRMTGCPNGCARPYMAEGGFVGDGPRSYQIWLGGSPGHTRLAEPFMDKMKVDKLEETFEPLFSFFKARRQEGESFGDFCARVGFDVLRAYLQAYVPPKEPVLLPRVGIQPGHLGGVRRDGLRSELAQSHDLGLRGELERLESVGLDAHAGEEDRLLGGHVGLEVGPQDVEAHAGAEVPEALALLPPGFKEGEQRLERLLQLVHLHLVHEGFRQARVPWGAPQPDLVRPRAVPDEAALGHVGAGAPVGAARHADHEALVPGAHPVQEGHKAGVNVWEAALGLGHGQPAQGQGGAGDGRGIEAVRGVGPGARLRVEAGGLEGRLHRGPVGGVDARQDEVLLRRDDGVQPVLLNDLPEGLLGHALHPPVLHVHPAVQLAVPLLAPPQVVHMLPRGQRLEGLELLPVVLLRHPAELVHSPLMQQVLQARLLAVVPAAVVPLRRHDGLDGVEDVVLRDVADGLGHHREGGLVPVGAPHAPPHDHVE